MKKITSIRRSVCIIANNLHKAGYALSEAFRLAWHRARETVCRVSGTSYGTRQKSLERLAGYRPEELTVGLQRDPGNQYDRNAIKILVRIDSLNVYAHVGYLPAKIAEQIAPVIDAGVKVRAELKGVIGGYSYKENYGMLIHLLVA